jgi:hypothetical protein
MRPLGAPTVFNFYEPDYRQPGEVTEAGPLFALSCRSSMR